MMLDPNGSWSSLVITIVSLQCSSVSAGRCAGRTLERRSEDARRTLGGRSRGPWINAGRRSGGTCLGVSGTRSAPLTLPDTGQALWRQQRRRRQRRRATGPAGSPLTLERAPAAADDGRRQSALGRQSAACTELQPRDQTADPVALPAGWRGPACRSQGRRMFDGRGRFALQAVGSCRR